MPPLHWLLIAGAYLLGSIPFGYLVYRVRFGKDIRTEGSGNIGATNVMRRAGTAAGLATLALDFSKGLAAVIVVGSLTDHHPVSLAAAAFAAIVGHVFPVFLRFRGGKGMATALGVFLLLTPWALGVFLLVFVAVVALFRYVSLGSILAVGAFPFATLVLDQPPAPIAATSFAAAVLIIARHHANISRLWNGAEKRLGMAGRRT